MALDSAGTRRARSRSATYHLPRWPDGSAHYRGVVTCGSVTACPVCAAKVRQASRAEEIDRALGRHLAAGGGAVFVTLTMPHDAGMALERVWDAVSGAWAAIVAGRHRMRLREEFGLIGYVRAVEVTHGRLAPAPARAAPDRGAARPRRAPRFPARALGAARDCRRVPGAGAAPWRARASGVLRRGVGGYLTKLAEDEGPGHSPGLELARTDLKAGRSWGSRAPFRILADRERLRHPSDWRLFEEWLHVAKVRRSLEWSRGLRARLLPDEQERTDEELAEEADLAEEIAALEPDVWGEVVRRGLNVAVLAAVEAQARRPAGAAARRRAGM